MNKPVRSLLLLLLIILGVLFAWGENWHKTEGGEVMEKRDERIWGEGVETIYFAGGCFWGMERLFESVDGVLDVESGYANGRADMVPDYESVCAGDTGYREAVKVVYDSRVVSLPDLLKAFFYVIDPTVEKRQGNDVGDQYQTGIYYADESSGETVKNYASEERQKHDRFAVEIEPLHNFYRAEDYHQDYLRRNPGGYCHISPAVFADINHIIGREAPAYSKPSAEELRERLSDVQFAVTQHGATERAFTGKYWNSTEKGIYVDVVTGEPLFSSADKYPSSCGWPSFTSPLKSDAVLYREDRSYGMDRVEVKSRYGESHLGHVFYNDPESPNGVRYCINSASLEFIPYAELDSRGYGEWKEVLDLATEK